MRHLATGVSLTMHFGVTVDLELSSMESTCGLDVVACSLPVP